MERHANFELELGVGCKACNHAAACPTGRETDTNQVTAMMTFIADEPGFTRYFAACGVGVAS